jgi:hypothetical protein
MNKVITGGPAFSTTTHVFSDGAYIAEGLTIRDYFAAKAMQALVQANFRSQEVIPHYAYILADSMLKERDGNS